MIIVVEKFFGVDDTGFPGKLVFEERSLWVVPVEFSGEIISVTYNMLLDTGSEITTLHPDDADLIEPKYRDQDTSVTGASGKKSLRPGRVDGLSIGEITFTEPTIHIGKLIPQFRKYEISGVLGANILNQMKLSINYPAKRLEMSKRVSPPKSN